MQHTYSYNNVLIRPFHPDDIDSVYEAVRESMKELSPWMSWCHSEYQKEETAEWINTRRKNWERGDEYDFVIVDRERKMIVGASGINQINRLYLFGNLGYWVRTSELRKGYATVATILAARFGFEQLNLNRLELVIAIGNTTSERVAEKAGAKKEGILRNRLIVHNKVYDALMYSLVREDLMV